MASKPKASPLDEGDSGDKPKGDGAHALDMDLANMEGAASDVNMLSVHSGHSSDMFVDESNVDEPDEPDVDEPDVLLLDAADSEPSSRTPSPAPDEEQIHEWEMEAEFDTLVFKPVEKIKGWAELQDQIKLELKKKAKTLPLSKINQLTIIRNFATLRLKGLGRMAASIEIARQWHEGEGNYFTRQVCALARHYQRFETLPVEKRGGVRASRSILCDETMRSAACN